MFSFIKKNMELQMQKYITTISLNIPDVEVLKHYCNSNKVCSFVAVHCNV